VPAGQDYVVVARAADLPPGTLLRVAYGDEPVVLANIGGKVRALADTCLHRGASLSEGRIRGGNVVCPWHAWTYDPASGRPIFPRSEGLCLATYPVRVDGDTIAIGPRAATGGSARDHG
jgi:nitrite reductase/ring-hydroxylating ferredoxin subunit